MTSPLLDLLTRAYIDEAPRVTVELGYEEWGAVIPPVQQMASVSPHQQQLQLQQQQAGIRECAELQLAEHQQQQVKVEGLG